MVFHRVLRLASMLVCTSWLGVGPALADGVVRDADLDLGLNPIARDHSLALSGPTDPPAIYAKLAFDLPSLDAGPWQRAPDVLSASERAAKRR